MVDFITTLLFSFLILVSMFTIWSNPISIFNARLVIFSFTNSIGYTISYAPHILDIITYSLYSIYILKYLFSYFFGVVFIFIYAISEIIGNIFLEVNFWYQNIFTLQSEQTLFLSTCLIVTAITGYYLRNKIKLIRKYWFSIIPFIALNIYSEISLFYNLFPLPESFMILSYLLMITFVLRRKP